jgi:hypothetical protein
MDQLRRNPGFRRLRGFDGRGDTLQGRSLPQPHRQIHSPDACERLQGTEPLRPLPPGEVLPRGRARGLAHRLSFLCTHPRSLGGLGMPGGARVHKVRNALLRPGFRHQDIRSRGSGATRYPGAQLHRPGHRARPGARRGVHALRLPQAADQRRLGAPDHAEQGPRRRPRPCSARAMRLYEARRRGELPRVERARLELRDGSEALPRGERVRYLGPSPRAGRRGARLLRGPEGRQHRRPHAQDGDARGRRLGPADHPAGPGGVGRGRA